jgi:hypothetical protein
VTTAEVERLRAELALVERDFDRAADLGVVRLTERLEPRIAELRRAIATAERKTSHEFAELVEIAAAK